MENKDKNQILIPVDFTEASYNAVMHGLKLANHLEIDATLVHIIDKESKSALKKSQQEVDDLENKLKELAGNFVQECKVHINTLCAEGSIYFTINEIADKIKATMIVLATHGKKGIQYLTGSRVLKVITNASVPVIVVQKRSFESGYRNIIFPLNNFSEIEQKLKWSVQIAKTFNSTLHLYEIPEEDQLPETKEKIGQVKAELERHEISFIEIKSDQRLHFADQLIEYSVGVRADLIMIMTNPDDITPSFLLGPWDEKIIYNAGQIPVMCINPKEADFDIIFPVFY